MEIVEIWLNLEKNATLIMITVAHYMWAENNKTRTSEVDATPKTQKPKVVQIC